MTTLAKSSNLFQSLLGRFARDSDDQETREIRREAWYFADVIRRRLTQLGLCYRFPKSKKDFMDRGVQEIKFVKAIGSPEAVYLLINTMLLPRGVNLAALSDETILNDLSVVCRRPVRFIRSPKSGAFFLIVRVPGKATQEHWQGGARISLYPLGGRRLGGALSFLWLLLHAAGSLAAWLWLALSIYERIPRLW